MLADTTNMCVCVCVCVCVCLYLSTVKASSVYNDVMDILGGADQRYCVEGIILDTSGKFLHLSFWIYHISTPKSKFRPIHKTDRKRYDICVHEKMIYIDIEYNSARQPKPTSKEKILKIRRLLESTFFHFHLNSWH